MNKARCEGCGKIKKIRQIVYFKGKMLCSNCRPRLGAFGGRPRATIEEALKRVYECSKNPIHVPSALKGLKLRFIIIEKADEIINRLRTLYDDNKLNKKDEVTILDTIKFLGGDINW